MYTLYILNSNTMNYIVYTLAARRKLYSHTYVNCIVLLMNYIVYVISKLYSHTYELHSLYARGAEDPGRQQLGPAGERRSVGVHNFNLRIFNLRVSNPNSLIVDVLFDTMSDLDVPGSRPNKNTMKFRKSTVQVYKQVYYTTNMLIQ